MWNMTRSYVRHDLRNTTQSYVRHDSFSRQTWLIYVRSITNSYVRHDSFTCETWLSHACLECPTTGEYGALHHTPHCNTLQQIVIHCILQHTATHCNILDTATHCSTLQHTATHCNTPQHTRLRHLLGKPHCNTLQHTTTHKAEAPARETPWKLTKIYWNARWWYKTWNLAEYPSKTVLLQPSWYKIESHILIIQTCRNLWYEP